MLGARRLFHDRFGLGSALGAANFIHDAFEVVHILKAAIHAGKADITHLVQTFELIHHQLAQTAGIDFALARVEQAVFDAVNGFVDQLRAHGALAQGDLERALQRGALVLDAPAVLLDDGGQADLGTLIGGEALVATATTAAAANEAPILGLAGFDHLRVRVAAKGALHGRSA